MENPHPESAEHSMHDLITCHVWCNLRKQDTSAFECAVITMARQVIQIFTKRDNIYLMSLSKVSVALSYLFQ